MPRVSARAPRKGPRSVILCPKKSRIKTSPETIAEYGMPGQGTGRARSQEARTERCVGAPLGDRSQQTGDSSRSIAIVGIEENDDVRSSGLVRLLVLGAGLFFLLELLPAGSIAFQAPASGEHTEQRTIPHASLRCQEHDD